ncbi:MAG: DUF1573 domain-containing protein [Chitinophagaceae bacterium]|nr:DUF1573 domain-containing protein [Chitinophagaceae bacterium]
MKRLYLLILLVSIISVKGYSQKLSQANTEPLSLKETTFDFGRIPQGRPVYHVFEVTNKGKTPLIIENVEATCGCTTPEWSEKPIAPGATAPIKVGFNASSDGKFQKGITIYYGENKIKGLTITGEVYPMPTTSAPVNTSLSVLKQ